MATLKRLLVEEFNIKITMHQYSLFVKHMVTWELRDNHAEALNSASLGVIKAYFLPKDTQMLYEIFDVDSAKFKRVIRSAEDLDETRNVQGDPYNILTIWVVHLILNSKLSRKTIDAFVTAVLKMMMYKFFTGVVHSRLRHGADAETMAYTINNLSAKFDIKNPKTPTWKLVMEAIVADMWGPKSVHHRRLMTFSTIGNQAPPYVISDMQTRIRSKLQKVISRFYIDHEQGSKIHGESMVSGEGNDKEVKALVSNFDNMSVAIANQALNLNKFIVREDIELVAKLSKNIRPDTLRQLLIKFSEVAVEQQRSGKAQDTIGKDSSMILVGYKEFITQVIHKTYRAAIMDPHVDIRSRLQIFDKVRNIYRSSRISDVGILVIKNSAEAFVNKYSDSKRPSTNASLKIALITYLILLSFKEM